MSRRIFILTCSICLLCACLPAKPGNDSTAPDPEAHQTAAGEDSQSEDSPSRPLMFESFNAFLRSRDQAVPIDSSADASLQIAPKAYRGGRKLSMPTGYLAAPLNFEKIAMPTGSPKVGFALVGSDLAVLYAVPTQAEIDAGSYGVLKKISPIPYGTVLPLHDIITANGKKANQDEEDYGVFEFENEFNFFYLTEFDGKRGVVFGADLIGIPKYRTNGSDADTIAKLAYYHTKPQRTAAFAPLDGMNDLPEPVLRQIQNERMAFAPAPHYYLGGEHTDDLVAVYRNAAYDRATTVFVSTDLFVHSLHKLFNNMLTDVEQERFIPILKTVIQSYVEAIESRIAADDHSVSDYSTALERCRAYFTIAKVLLAMAPVLPVNQYGETENEASLPDVDIKALLEILPPGIRQELELILTAKGPDASPNFLYEEDYSQFRPRGHYNKNPRLRAYFRTMTFLGRINLYLDFSTPEASRISTSLGPVALICNQIYHADPALQKHWRSLHDPITWLIGASDDINFDDLAPILGDARNADLQAWMKNGRMIEELKRIGERARSPQIQGNKVWENAAGANQAGSGDTAGEAPKGWRLFGQRFVLDASWTDRLTGGGITHAIDEQNSEYRTMASGLDIAAALGSKAAYAYLGETRNNFPKYQEILDQIITENKEQSASEWNATFYSRYLQLCGSIMTFEQGAGLYYTTSELWNKRALQSGMAAWAELHHDTILYVKQSFAEKAAGGGPDTTFRTRQFERPQHVIEPNLPFFYRLADLLEQCMPLLQQHKLITPRIQEKLESFQKLVNRATAIVETQAQDKAIGREDNEWILSIPSQLSAVVVPGPVNEYDMDPDKFRMALVADVHTDVDNAQVLEVGIGKPLTIYVALNDGFGGKRIAKGFVLSYYEFPSPMSQRMTVEEWKEFIYGKPEPQRDQLESRRPSWLKGVLP